MEKFVDRIIETDRKAREIIEAAQQEKAAMQKDFAARTQTELAQRKRVQAAEMARQDEALAAREDAAADEAYSAYIAAKHRLDNRFEAGRGAWLQEIVSACKQSV